MAGEFYGYFDSVVGDEREYDAAQFAHVLRAALRNGITSHNNGGLLVTAEGGTMRTAVGEGGCVINGYLYVLSDDGGAAKTFDHVASAASDRYDRVVARLELMSDQRRIGLRLLSGTPGASPTPPALTRNNSVYELSLAKVRIRAGAESVEAADITDERGDESLCGYAVPARLSGTALDALYAGHETATAQADGLMSAADKAAHDGLVTQVPALALALTPVEMTATLYGATGAAGTAGVWSGSEAPYTQVVAAAGMTAGKRVSVGLAPTATDAQYIAAAGAALLVVAQGAGTLTVKARGALPTVDLPILIRMEG